MLIALLTDGHVLLEGAPGLAKTRIARLLAGAMDAGGASEAAERDTLHSRLSTLHSDYSAPSLPDLAATDARGAPSACEWRRC